MEHRPILRVSGLVRRLLHSTDEKVVTVEIKSKGQILKVTEIIST